MVTTQSGRQHCTADILQQLAHFVERTGMTPGEFGTYLSQAIDDRGEFLNRQGKSDLLRLCSCASSASEFAEGLRRQADRIRERVAG